MLPIIFAILVLLIAIFLASSIRLRFEFNEKTKYASIAYLFLTAFFDIAKQQLSIRLLGITIKKLGFDKEGRPATAKQKFPQKPETRKKWFSWPDLKWVFARWLWQLIRKIRIRHLKLDFAGGFEDPYYTGHATAIYWTARGIAPKIMSHVAFSPDFDANKMTYSGKGLITLRMFYIIKLVVRLLTDMLKTKIRSLSILRTKGVSYG